MARRKTTDPKKREIEITAAAFEEALRRINDGRATDALLSLLIKQGSANGIAMRERMIAQTGMYNAQIEAINEDKKSSALFEEAIAAMQRYQGKKPENEVDNEAI